jgi:hypothetical protein
MRARTDREDPADAVLSAGEGEAEFDAWTLDELDDELGALRSPFTGGADAGG